jgi:Derlin-2/3
MPVLQSRYLIFVNSQSKQRSQSAIFDSLQLVSIKQPATTTTTSTSTNQSNLSPTTQHPPPTMPPQPNNVNDLHNGDNSPTAYIQALPLVTRYWLGATVMTTLAVNFGMINAALIPFYWEGITAKFELWRFLSCFLYVGPFSFGMLISFFLLVQFSERYERGGPFNTGAGGGTADYIFMMMILTALMLVTYPLALMVFPLPPFFAQNLIFAVVYTWSKQFPTASVNIWGVPVPGTYVPFAFLGLRVLTGSAVFDILHGMAVAHVYYFLADVVPQVQGREILQTPQFLVDKFGVGLFRPEPAAPAAAAAPRAGGFGAAPARPAAAAGGHSWGTSGQRLGRG